MRPDASENSQINPSTIVRAARAAGSQPHLASGFQGCCKIATLHAGFGVIRGMSGKRREREEREEREERRTRMAQAREQNCARQGTELCAQAWEQLERDRGLGFFRRTRMPYLPAMRSITLPLWEARRPRLKKGLGVQ